MMVPVPIPVPSGDPAELAELRLRVLMLEQALAAALSRLSAAGIGEVDQGAAHEAVVEVGRLVACGRAPEAARRYRELFGVTWDEAHAAVARWHAARGEELARRLWLKRWVEAQTGPKQVQQQTGGK
jgi:hypothetical protein